MILRTQLSSPILKLFINMNLFTPTHQTPLRMEEMDEVVNNYKYCNHRCVLRAHSEKMYISSSCWRFRGGASLAQVHSVCLGT